MTRWSVRARAAADEGMTLAMVLFISLIGMACGAAIVATTTFTIRQASVGRETIQARSAAEAGLDAAIGVLEKRSGISLPCTLSGTMPGVSQNPTYNVTLTYLSDTVGANGEYEPLGCPPSEAPAQVLVTSIGTSQAGVGGAAATERTMEAALRLRAGAASWAEGFGNAVFSNAAPVMSNSWTVAGAGADFYTNGNFRCQNSNRFSGNVHAQGTASMTNSCAILGDLWASGNVSTTTAAPSVSGRIKSSKGGMTMGNSGITVGGPITLAGSLVIQDGKSINQAFKGQTPTVSQNLGSMDDPPRQEFPKVTFTQSTWETAGWTYRTWSEFMVSTKNASTPSWWTDYCTVSSAGWALSGPMISPAGGNPTVVDARSCSQLLLSNTNTLKLRGDLTIIATKFVSDNLTVTSVEADGVTPSTQQRNLRIIVPWTTASECAASPTTTMQFNNQTQISPTVSTLLYTSGGISMSNNFNVTGQIYSCGIMASNAPTLTFNRVGAPTSDASTSATYRVDVEYKRDTL